MAQRTVGRRNLVALGWAISAIMAALFFVVLTLAMIFALTRAAGTMAIFSETAVAQPAAVTGLVGLVVVALTAAAAIVAYRGALSD